MGGSQGKVSKDGRPEGREDAAPPAPFPQPPGPPVLAAYFVGPYLHGEVLQGGASPAYATVSEEVYAHAMERLVLFFEHKATQIRVWSEALDLRAAHPGSAAGAAVVFHYTTRDGLLQILDYQQPIAAALQCLKNEAGCWAVSTKEPVTLGKVLEPRLKYCLPLLVPPSCCRGGGSGSSLKDVLLAFNDEQLQRISAHGWILRPKMLDRLQGPGGAVVSVTQDFWRCLGDYGVGLMMAGHAQLALQTCRQAFDGCRAQLGAMNPDVLRLQHNVAVALHLSGHVEAEQMFHSVWQNRSQSLGPHHPATLHSLSELATVVGRRSLKDAQELQRQVLKGKQAYYGVSHPESVSAMVSLAYSLWKEQRRSEAEDLYRRALLIAESTLGPSHPTTLHCLNNLAVIAKESGRAGELGRLLGRRPGSAQTAPALSV